MTDRELLATGTHLTVECWCLLGAIATYIFGYVVGRLRRRFYLNRYGLSLLLVAASLSGCLTASKIHRWESALLGWARKGKPECVESAKVASTYLTNANRTLQGATSALDLAADGEAKKLMQDAAQKCGEVVP